MCIASYIYKDLRVHKLNIINITGFISSFYNLTVFGCPLYLVKDSCLFVIFLWLLRLMNNNTSMNMMMNTTQAPSTEPTIMPVLSASSVGINTKIICS